MEVFFLFYLQPILLKTFLIRINFNYCKNKEIFVSVISATYGRNSVTVCVSKKKISPSICIMDITTNIKSMLVVVQFLFPVFVQKRVFTADAVFE